MLNYNHLTKKINNFIFKIKNIINYKETNNYFLIISFILIGLISYIILYSNLITSENLISTLALFISLITVFVTTQFNFKSLNQTKQNIITQLEYNDKKTAINNFYKILNTLTSNDPLYVISDLKKYIYSYEGNLIYNKSYPMIYKQVNEILKFEKEYAEERVNDMIENMEPDEKIEFDMQNAGVNDSKDDWYDKRMKTLINDLKEIFDKTNKTLLICKT